MRDIQLSGLYQMYAMNNLSRRNLEVKIFQYLLDNYKRFRLFNKNKDRWNEFISWLYPRLGKAIDRYTELGSSFDTYIIGLVHNAAREYRCRESEHYMAEYICWKAMAEDMLIQEKEPEYSEGHNDISLPKDIYPRQILFLLLKSYYFVTDEFAERVSRTIGMEFTVVKAMIDELRNKRSRKEAEILSLRERVHSQHYRCLKFQKRLEGIQAGTEYHTKMKERWERARRRFCAMRKRLRGMSVSPSNRLIAEVMGIPQGTIDSGLFSIKNRLLPYVNNVDKVHVMD